MVDAPDEKCEPDLPPANAACAETCQTISCTDPHRDCDQKLVTGCEIDTDNDKNNCGECGNKCNVFPCNDGECKP